MAVSGVTLNTYQSPYPAVKENLRASTSASADAMISGKAVSDKMVQIALTYQIVSELQSVDSQSSEKHLRRLLQQVLTTSGEQRPLTPSQQSEMLNSLIANTIEANNEATSSESRPELTETEVYQAAGQLKPQQNLGVLLSVRA